jgi:hypothetical protein
MHQDCNSLNTERFFSLFLGKTGLWHLVGIPWQPLCSAIRWNRHSAFISAMIVQKKCIYKCNTYFISNEMSQTDLQFQAQLNKTLWSARITALYLYCLTCEFWGFHVRFIDNSGVSECHAAWRGKWFPIFRRNLSPSSSAVQGPIFMEPDILKMKAPRSFEPSGTTYPAIQREIPEEWNSHFLNCWIKKCNYIRPKIMFHGSKTILNVVTFKCVNVRVWGNLMSCIKGREWAEGVSQQGTEKCIWMREWGFRKLYSEKVEESCWPNIIRVIKWVRIVAWLGEKTS